jgi:leucyl-tRNA synthetase
MAEYNFQEIEKKWQRFWEENDTYRVTNNSTKPKYYVLDMFPYPSGAGLHVGHPLGYIASDVVARYKRLKGFNVLHPMGFDSFGLPAEQYAIQTGQHPAITTEQNINRYKEQLKNMGFSYDWNREVQTSSPNFYKWTQWIFSRLFEHWYNRESNRAEPIENLISVFEKKGNANVQAVCDEETPPFTAQDWKQFSEKRKQEILLNYRLTYLADTTVNWCPTLGTVLANDEVKDGFSERGGYPVERKKMKQWMMRITAYADRLLEGLERVDWSDALKEMQRNWIGKSYGCELDFRVKGQNITLTAFTTRPDTIYGVTYVVLAPEHELISKLTTSEQEAAVQDYAESASNRSERERMADVKSVSGVFTGSYVVNPINGEEIPLWVADYVLAGYGTGVVMAVPSSDDRDFRFASHFNLPIRCVIEGTEKMDDPTSKKHGKMINSGFMNGMESTEAIQAVIAKVEADGTGRQKVNYRIRDAVFSRQRYWGEPVPVYFKDNIPQLIPTAELPLKLPAVNEYKPTEEGEPPLARAKEWKYNGRYEYELTTMPGWAGSSWYHFRYMDPENTEEPFSKEAQEYWQSVDLYIGGTEHATGHLLYSRFWTKFLYDIGRVNTDEPYQKLINQGMIQGQSAIAYRVKGTSQFVSYNLRKEYNTSPMHVDISMVNEKNHLNLNAFRNWRDDLHNAEFIMEGDVFVCGTEVEKMSKRLYNVVNPDDVVNEYGADTLRMYEMFLGPLEQSKPWNTQGIDGVFKFLRKFWRLFYDEDGNWMVNDRKPSEAALKTINKTIKKAQEDIDQYSFNTSVSAFMICVNELQSEKCHSKSVLEPLCIIISPYAPHICEELWLALGNKESIVNARFPAYEEKYLQESSFEYPVSVNGKVRTKISFPVDMDKATIEKQVLNNVTVKKWLQDKSPKKVIVVPNRIVNVVV